MEDDFSNNFSSLRNSFTFLSFTSFYYIYNSGLFFNFRNSSISSNTLNRFKKTTNIGWCNLLTFSLHKSISCTFANMRSFVTKTCNFTNSYYYFPHLVSKRLTRAHLRKLRESYVSCSALRKKRGWDPGSLSRAERRKARRHKISASLEWS